MGEAKDSESSTSDSGAETPHGAFDFRNFHSDFAEVFEIDTWPREPRTPSTQHHSVPRYSQGPRYSRALGSARAEPDPESTMQGLQRKKIGLLGEIFVSNASRSFINLFETPFSQLIGQ
jgi:hypothetical protein